MEHFQNGDVVELKSGGPKMTVVGIMGTTIQCTYHDDKEGKTKNGFFDPASLKKVTNN